MTLGKTIQIYLPDGNPRGAKIAEITSRTVQAVLVPRSKLEYVSSRSELRSVGVYFLIGNAEIDAKPTVYVGEAEDCLARLKQQNKAKDFWSTVLVFVSKTNYFTKTHIKYLEWYCHEQACQAARYQVENSTIPTRPYISEPVEADLLDNFDTIKVLASTLGYPIFEQIQKPEKKDVLTCRGKSAYAEGEYTEEGLVVFAGSKCNLKETPSATPWIVNLHQRLVEDGVLKRNGNVRRFDTEHVFSSPSAAAAVVLGRQANGWTEWKYKNGETLDEVQRGAPD